MNQVKIGKFILRLRTEKGLTQAELANKLGVTDRAVSNWENGRRMPDIAFLPSLCDILDISMSELLTGERLHSEEKELGYKEILLNTLDDNKKNKRKIIGLFTILVVSIFSFLTLFIIQYKSQFPKIDIYSLMIQDAEASLNKIFDYQDSQVYFYGVDGVSVCNSKEECFGLKNALMNSQIEMEQMKKYLDSQYSLGNLSRYILWDGGTTMYQNERYAAIFCHTVDGNNDIYFGIPSMEKDLDGGYCGHEKSRIKRFIRTFHIISIEENNEEPEFMDVTLRDYKNKVDTISLNKSNYLVVGKDYEMTFSTFQTFEDTTFNIFQNSTLLEIKETEEQINEPIVVNLEGQTEVDNISMQVVDGTLSPTGMKLLITDYNEDKYVYGLYFYIEKKVKGEWVSVPVKSEHLVVFPDKAYFVDKNYQLVLDMNWEYVYGKLASGTYRIVKRIFLEKDRPIDENYLFKTISMEFQIE